MCVLVLRLVLEKKGKCVLVLRLVLGEKGTGIS